MVEFFEESGRPDRVVRGGSDEEPEFGLVQSVLFGIFAVAIIFGPGQDLFMWPRARFVGNFLCAFGLIFMLAAIVALREVIRDRTEPRAGGHLVTRGLYHGSGIRFTPAFSRWIIGLFLRRPTLLVAIVAVVVAGFLMVKTRFEESRLAARYTGYAAYKSRTWGVIPGLSCDLPGPRPSRADAR